jgi:hypothetical protein
MSCIHTYIHTYIHACIHTRHLVGLGSPVGFNLYNGNKLLGQFEKIMT